MEKSSDSDLLEAMQVLWDHCHDSLEKLGVEHRRGSDKRSLLDAVLADILDVDKLDVDDTIPLIFCEASDLLKLNSDAVLSSPKSLSEELQGKVSRSDGVADRLKQKLDTMQADMKCAVTFAITSLSSDLSSFSKEACSISIVFLTLFLFLPIILFSYYPCNYSFLAETCSYKNTINSTRSMQILASTFVILNHQCGSMRYYCDICIKDMVTWQENHSCVRNKI